MISTGAIADPAARRIALLVPDMPDTDALLPYLRRIDAARWYTNFGPLALEFESRLSECLDRERPPGVVSVSSCTSGLQLALLALGLAPGSRVIVPAFTFVATAAAVIRAGCIPVVVDIDAGNWLLTPEAARTALHEGGIAAVMPVTTFGATQDAAAWDRFVEETGVPVIIDAAGAYGNQKVGRHTVVVFSLHATKSLGVGEGGFVAARSSAILEEVRRLSNFGIQLPSGIVDRAGINAKLSEYHAAVGLAALERWPARAQVRRELARGYLSAIGSHCAAARPQQRPADGVYTIMSVCLPAGVNTTEIASALAEQGIETRLWYNPPIPDHPGFAGAAVCGSLPSARALSGRVLGLPFHTAMSTAEVERVCASLARHLC